MILSRVIQACKKMENERQETLAQNNNVMPEGVFLDFFKYPYASYLSGMMFKLIQESL